MILIWKNTAENLNNGDTEENKIIFRYSHDSSRYFLDSVSIDIYLDDDNFPNAQRTLTRV